MPINHVLQLSPLTKEHGLHVRAKMIRRAFKANGLEVSYVDIKSLLLSELIKSYVKQIFQVSFAAYDICFIHKPLPQNIFLGLIVRLRTKKLIVDIDDYEQGFHKQKFVKFLIKLSEGSLVYLASLVTTHSQSIEQYLKKTFKVRMISKLSQAIDDKCFKRVDSQETESLRCLLKIDQEKVCVYVASFTKGALVDFDKVWDLFLYLKSQCVIDKILLLGAGPQEKELKDFVAKSSYSSDVIWAGHVDNSRVREYIDLASIALVYMRTGPENIYRVSLKTLEYLARRKPVCGALVGETRKLLGEFVYTAGQCFSEQVQEKAFEKVLRDHSQQNLATELNLILESL